MSIKNQHGSVLSVVLIVVLALGLVGAGVFAMTQASQKNKYKSVSDAQIAAAVDEAKKVQAQELVKQFEEESKSPNKTYKSPVSTGSITFAYPKTWSAYVIEGTNNSQPINGYYYPNQVPGVDRGVSYALRVEMLNTNYTQVVEQASRANGQGAAPKVTAYIPPKMKEVANVQPGVRIDGLVEKDKTGAMVIIKVRDKTLKIYTESPDYLKDFNDTVLANLTFAP